MNWANFGAGFLAGLSGKTLLDKLFSLAGRALKGIFKTIIDATKRQFNEDVKSGKFDMRQTIDKDTKTYSRPEELKRWLKGYAKKHAYKGLLIQGHMYYFDYDDPLTKDKLEFYDTSPLILSFGIYYAKTGNIVEYGINLHMLPKNVREAFMIDIFNTYKSLYKSEMYSDKPRSINELDWQSLQKFVDKYGIDFAVRSYIPERRARTIIIDYQDWGKGLCLPSKAFVGITDAQLMKLYKQHLAERKR